MKPKLWDGPNAVGEARARFNETLAAPYQTALGPGFSARKMNGFSEVTGEQKGVEEKADGWISSSNNAAADVVFSGTESVYASFKKRGTQHNASPDAFFPGTSVRADSLGGAFSTVHRGDDLDSFNEIYARRYALVGLRGNGRRVKVLSGDIYTYVFNTPVSGNLLSAIGTGLTNGHSDVHFATEMTTWWHQDGDAVRAHPVLVVLAKINGSWLMGYVDLPYSASHDTDVPAYCHLGGNRIAAIWSTYPTEPPKVYYSENFGASWSNGIDVSGIIAGLDADQGTPPRTEAEIAALHPSWTAQQVRNEFMRQAQITRRFRAGQTGTAGLMVLPVSYNKLVVVTEKPYDTAASRVVAVSLVDVRTGVVRRNEWAVAVPEFYYGNTYCTAQVIGKGAWVVVLTKDDSSTLIGSYTAWAKVTFDFGVTYTDITLPENSLGWFIGVIKPYESSTKPYKLFILSTDADTGDRIMYFTSDLVTFKRGPVVGKVAWFGTGTADSNFTRAVYIGTRKAPGHFYPPAPWVLDDRVPTPDWWSTT